MTDIADVILKNNVSFLQNILYYLPEENPSYITLKSYYLNKSKLSEIKAAVSLPNKLTNSRIKCPNCAINRQEIDCTYRIAPENKPKRCIKRLLSKKNDLTLTKCQKTCLKKYKPNVGHNNLCFTCKLCKYTVKESLKKPQIEKKTCEIVKPPAKRKKRKKDRFSGLNEQIVLSITPNKIGRQVKSANTTNEKVDTLQKNKNNNVKKKTKGKLNMLLNQETSPTKRGGLNNFLKSI